MQNHIAFIAPSEAFAKVSKHILQEKHLDFNVYVATGRDTLALAKKLAKEDIKIIISRGYNVGLLRRALSVPVIDVKYTYEDIYYSYEQAKVYGNRIALVGFKEASHIAQLFQSISGNPIEIIEVNKLQNLSTQMSQAISNGVRVFIGGKTTELAAAKINAHYVSTSVTEEAIRSAINDALHLYRINEERAINQSIRHAILESTPNGIIAIDTHYNMLFINDLAERMLTGKVDQFINQYLSCVHKKNGVTETQGIQNQIVIFNNTHLAFDYEPIHTNDGKIHGYVATLQDIAHIQSTEKEIRKSLLSKSHIARNNFKNIIGQSDKNRACILEAQKYALTDATILITGESGTGKEIFAQSIHNFSHRKNEPFVAINCAAIPETLLESELFGHVKGSFTGARKEGKEGLFEIAHKGTIFLDEIGEVSKGFQVKLLRVLQEREVSRVGDSKIIPIDVRVIVATNRNLIKRIKKKKFREDLFYRLSVLQLNILPLRERISDIADLTKHFIAQYKKPILFSKEAMNILMSYDYPGNIRQLYNILERLIVLSDKKEITADLTLKVVQAEPILSQQKKEFSGKKKHYNIAHHRLVVNEKNVILETLHNNNGIKSITAKELGISTSTLWRKLKQYKNEE